MQYEFIDDPSPDLCKSVYDHLRKHNAAGSPAFWQKRDTPEHQAKPLNCFAFNDSGNAIGGLFGETQFLWLKVGIMAVDEALQRQGIGTRLLAAAEAQALERGCTHAYVDTMAYQAPGFYEKHGYTLAGKIENWDSHGNAKFFFTKRLKPTA